MKNKKKKEMVSLEIEKIENEILVFAKTKMNKKKERK